MLGSAPNSTILCIAPHPDDETLGCGMTLLRHIEEGDQVHWLIMSTMTQEHGFRPERISSRETEILRVAETYGFSGIHRTPFPTTRLDTYAKVDLVEAIAKVIDKTKPDCLYIPYRNDVHSDHTAVFDSAASCCKSFRYPSIRHVYAYETLSETEFSIRPDGAGFKPNLLVDGTKWLEQKLEIMQMYHGEIGQFPFPRSLECIRSLAMLRGSQAGTRAAEAFMILKEIR